VKEWAPVGASTHSRSQGRGGERPKRVAVPQPRGILVNDSPVGKEKLKTGLRTRDPRLSSNGLKTPLDKEGPHLELGKSHEIHRQRKKWVKKADRLNGAGHPPPNP